MKAPAFWWRRPGWEAAALAPAAALYSALAASRLARPGAHAGVPVLCIGNMTVGGAGKTPTALALASRLRARGRRPGFLLRGYGGREPGPLLVDPARHGPGDVGDEALLLAASGLPTVVARDRPSGAARLVEAGCDIVVMDDGMQNPSLAKDLTLAVVDAARGHGNGRALPAGPLRLAEAAQWPLVDAVMVIGEGEPGRAVAEAARARGLPVLSGRLSPDPAAAAAFAGRRVLAFAGIGHPDKFFATLAGCGAEIVARRSFPDHHPYAAREIADLLAEARRLDARPVTTEKDMVRVRPLLGGADGLCNCNAPHAEVPAGGWPRSTHDRGASFEAPLRGAPQDEEGGYWGGAVATLPVTLAFEDEDALDRLLDRL